jgi:hypothetical protein
MRRIALLALTGLLSGCGYQTWWNPPLSSGYNPNTPHEDSENLRRVMGAGTQSDPINVEAGNIWPAAVAPEPTLADIEQQSGIESQPQQPKPGSPLARGVSMPDMPAMGSSTPPGSNQPGLAPVHMASPKSGYNTPAVPPPARAPGGEALQGPGGTSVVTGGTAGYQTAVQPGSGQSIIVPNGNGTSTVIHSDGRIETIPTPK